MPASPRRRLEARQRGEVSQSRLLRVSGQLLVTVVAMSWLGSGLIEALAGMMRVSLGNAAGGLGQGVSDWFEPTAMAVLPLLVVGVMASVLIGLVQTGWLFALSVPVPKWERLNPSAGLARMVGGGSVARCLTVVGQLLIIVGVGGWLVGGHWSELLSESMVPSEASEASEAGAAGAASRLLGWLTVRGLQLAGCVAVVLLALGVLDWFYQRWRFEQQLKMTPEEWRAEQRLEQSRRPRRRSSLSSSATFQQVGESVD
jgi:flagellar biosynthetic protein FlhB